MAKTSKSGKKRRVNKKVSDADREQMFLWWLEDKPMSQIARRYGIHANTVVKIKRDDDWDGRKEQIRKKVQKRTDNRIAIKLQKELNVIDVVISSQAQALAAEIKKKKVVDLDLGVLEKFLRLKRDYVEFVDPETPEPEPEEPEDPVGKKVRQLGDDAIDTLIDAAVERLKKNAGKEGKPT